MFFTVKTKQKLNDSVKQITEIIFSIPLLSQLLTFSSVLRDIPSMKTKASVNKAKPTPLQTEHQAPAPELAAFSLAAAIQEARSTPRSTSSSTQPRKIFHIVSSPLRKKAPSQVSLATNTSFATANDSVQNDTTNTPGASYFDSSDEEDNTFANDPLAVLSRVASTPTNTEIVFETTNPEETMPSKKSNKISPVQATAVPATVAPVTKTPASTTPVTTTDEPHFDVAQNVYSHAKGIWAWGKTVPVISNILGLTEAVTTKVLDTAVHMDLPAIDSQVAQPNLKKLDDEVVTPVILAVWKLIGPAVSKSEEMFVKPVMTEVVPRILAPIAMVMGDKKEEKKSTESGPNPEYTSAPMVN